ncbi:MAG: ubiquinone biosynthesis regulatory protein kinase UbiB [Gammaproteobacteria bacterium RBG_16_57_12]|nr:MAG: ubiquinone biosynthesis regulatory protein kinase UbiB [Gammaproteobacteria bacterium RBG_16_57_12]
MINPGQIFRLLYINRVLVRHGLDEIILATHLFRPFRFLMYLAPWYWLRSKQQVPRGVRIRLALEELGPIFVKFGQILSTRPDLIPDDIIVELRKLQDKVPSFPGSEARCIIEKAYGHGLSEVFSQFDEQPLASASIAQVHAARLLDGREVIVKVVRPRIDRVIRRDVGLMYTVAVLAERYWGEAKRLRPVAVVGEFEKTIFDELDLLREAASASQLRRNFDNSALLYVPQVHWPDTRRNVMVMERISGIPISDIAGLRAAGIDLKTLAEQGVEIFFTQVFRDNFFHADMHPGNIFVSPQGQYIAIDFGIMGTLSPEDKRYLAENFLAFFKRDYRRVAELHVESRWVPAGTRVDEFESAIRSVCEPIFEKPLKDISLGRLLINLFQTARRFNMEIQPQLVLLQKTLLNIEGLGRQLYPDLDLWVTAKPFLERWMHEELGAGRAFATLRRNLPLWGEILPELPGLVHDVLRQARQGSLHAQPQLRELQALRSELRRSNRRSILAIIGTGLILSAAVILGLDGRGPLMVGGAPLLTWLLGGLGAVVLLAAWPQEPD